MRIFRKFVSLIKSFIPDYHLLMKLGYKATTFNQEFILEKEMTNITLRIHQSIEPFNPILGPYIDFDLNDNACVVVDGAKISEEKLNRVFEYIGGHFDHSYLRRPYLFLFDKKMELTSPQLPDKLESLEQFIKQIV